MKRNNAFSQSVFQNKKSRLIHKKKNQAAPYSLKGDFLLAMFRINFNG
jgi:hypothetical protein